MSRVRFINARAEQVEAIIASRKTQWRQPAYGAHLSFKELDDNARAAFRSQGCRVEDRDDKRVHIDRPTLFSRIETGDRLCVREALARSGESWMYASDDTVITMRRSDPRCASMVAWAHHQERDYVPPQHMPRWTSRITLLVIARTVGRLHAISEDDAASEGADRNHAMKWPGGDPGTIHDTRRRNFCALWRSLHGPRAWDANPEVVAITFKPIFANVDLPEAEAA